MCYNKRLGDRFNVAKPKLKNNYNNMAWTEKDLQNLKNKGFKINDNKNTENEENKEDNNLPNNNVKKDNTITNTNPKTGDNVIVYFVMLSIAILGIITLAIVNVKRK